MQRLTGGDAHFLYEEKPGQHRHTIKVLVIDPSTSPGGLTFETLKTRIASRAHELPPYRWRLIPVPGKIFHPSWLELNDLDVDEHVHKVTVSPPGGDHELAALVSELASRPLDRSKPLWEAWYAEGLAEGYVAVIAKFHHALADGSASAQLIIESLETNPDPEILVPPAVAEEVVHAPSGPALFRDAVRDLLKMTTRFPGLVGRTAAAGRSGLRRRRSKGPMPAAAFSGPMTRFNRTLTSSRWYAFTTVPLEDIKAVKDALDATVNDVVLAICGGSVRSYLIAHDELPTASLTAAVPISIRQDDEARDWGNRLSNMFTTLGTDIEDPVARLRAIHDRTAAAKEHHDAKDPRLQHDWFGFYPLWRVYLLAALGMARTFLHKPAYNVIVSNVKGPTKPLYANGARLVAIHSMGPLVDELGLNFTAWSYLDQMSFGVTACEEHVPDIWALADGLHEALDELKKAAGI